MISQRIAAHYATLSNDHQGILWMIFSTFWFSLITMFGQMLATGIDALSPPIIIFYRNAFGVIIFLIHLRGIKKKSLKTTKLPLYCLRAFLGLCSMMILVYCMAILPMPMFTAITFTLPLFIMVFGIFLLKETVILKQWVALGVGFAGVLLIAKPSSFSMQLASYILVFATVLWALNNIVVKKIMLAGEEPDVATFYATLLITLFSIPVAVIFWKIPSLYQCFLLVLLAIVAFISQYALAVALSKCEYKTLLPYDFMRLVFSSIIAYIAFGDLIDAYTFVGGCIIMSAAIYATASAKKNDVQELALGVVRSRSPDKLQ